MKYYDKLAQDKQWTILLRSLPEGVTRVTFHDEEGLKTCRTLAYQPYGETRRFSFSFKRSAIPLEVDINKTRVN